MKSDMRNPEDVPFARQVAAVYVDGVKIPKTFMFDDESGIVLSYAVNDQGHVKADENRNPIEIEHHGVVTFDLKVQPE